MTPDGWAPSASRRRITHVEIGGAGGMLRYAALLAARAENDDRLMTAAKFDETAVHGDTPVLPILFSPERGGMPGVLASLRSERLVLRSVRDQPDEAWFVNAGLLVRAAGENVVQMIHDPKARPIAGSQMLGAKVTARRVRTPRTWVGYHGPSFDIDSLRRRIQFPHPAGPASFSPASCAISEYFGVDPVETTVLCFGRAAEPAALQRLEHKLSRAVPTRNLLILASSTALSDETRKHRLHQYIFRQGRIPNRFLDALVAQSDLIAVPHEGYPESASGILSIAAFHGKLALVFEGVDPRLVEGGVDAAVGLDQLEDAVLNPSRSGKHVLIQGHWRDSFEGLVAHSFARN